MTLTDISTESDAGRAVAGRYVVLSMFLFGIAATGLLFAYWNLHLMPFMPLQKAIVQEFPGSAPRVDGGKRKLHRDSAVMLRVVMQVPFDPTEESVAVKSELERYMTRLRDLAGQHVQEPCQLLEAHFYFQVKEKEIREQMIRRDLKTWVDVERDGQPADSVISPALNLNETTPVSAP